MSNAILVALASVFGFQPIAVDPPPTGSMATASSAVTAATSSLQGIRLTGVVDFHESDADGDDLAEALIAEVEVEVLAPGSYSLTGRLSKAGQLISNRPGWDNAMFSRTTLQADRGTHIASLAFSGEQIYRSDEDGPYTLTVHALGGDSNDSLTVASPPYDHARFGEVGARITDANEAPIDEDGDGEYEFIEATFTVAVRRADDYFLQGSLSKMDQSLADAGASFRLTRGAHRVTLRFPGLPLRRSGADGPYEGSVTLIESGRSVEGTQFQTRAYAADEFAPLLELDGRFAVRPIDSNGNGLFDTLRVELGIAVRRPGSYRVAGSLGDPDRSRFIFADTVVTLLRDPRIVALDFDGGSIRELGMDGPFTLDIALRDPESYEELDRVRLDETTAAYRSHNFEPYDWAEIMLTARSSDMGIDADGNGLYDSLRVDLELELAKPDFYEWRARLVDSNENEIDAYTGTDSLAAGTTTITFLFSGTKIAQNSVDGPYYLKSLLIFGRGGAYTIVTDPIDTHAYKFGEFGSRH